MLLSTDGFVQEPVGVRYFPATQSHPPLRLFYPAAISRTEGTGTIADAGKKNEKKKKKPYRPFRWLHENGVAYYLAGYARLALRSRSWWQRLILLPLIHLVSVLLPVRWRTLPNVFWDAPLLLASGNNSTKNLMPAIVFSHGLTGTGQENALLLASWASRGFLVVSVHHTDGSSSRVRLADGDDLDYEHGPPFHNYDADFRPRQIEHRAAEILQACDFVESLSLSGRGEYPTVKNFCVAGFSYGAATAARVVTMASSRQQRSFAAALLLDGWFYVDVSESANVEFPFPQQAFDETDNNNALKNLPCLFINSEQFTTYPKLWKATKKLVALANGSSSSNDQDSNKRSELHVIKDTGHQNFCDAVFWLPTFVLRRLLGKALGSKDPVEAYREIASVSGDFLVRHVQPKEKTN